MRVARILAILLAMATLGVTIFYVNQMPYAYYYFLPANAAATGCLIFWIKAPARKKARWRAAFASLAVVPCIALTAVFGILFTPIEVWQVYSALSALALIVAIWAIVRVKRKASHPWADYYKKMD